MNQSGWEHFEHQADVGICGFGDTLEKAFQEAASALTAVITPVEIKAVESFYVSCAASTIEDLFVVWLNNLIYEMATRNILVGHTEVTIHGTTLNAMVRGEPVDVSRHQPTVEVKGATYTELKIHKNEDEIWVARCVLDV